MDDFESNCMVLRSIFGSCLSDINSMSNLWYYGILFPEEHHECSLSSILNIRISELKSILQFCGLIKIKDNVTSFVNDVAGTGGDYNWEIFRSDHSLLDNYYDTMCVNKFKHIQKNMWFIGLGKSRSIIINPASQFKHSAKERVSVDLNKLLKLNVNRMKSIVRVNNYLLKISSEEHSY